MNEKFFPIMEAERDYAKPHPSRIPWSVADLAYAKYSSRYGNDQSLETLAQRGGFCPREMDEFLPDWIERCDEVRQLRARVVELKQERNDYKADAEGFVETLQMACHAIDSYGFRSDDYGGSETLITAIRKLGNQRDELQSKFRDWSEKVGAEIPARDPVEGIRKMRKQLDELHNEALKLARR